MGEYGEHRQSASVDERQRAVDGSGVLAELVDEAVFTLDSDGCFSTVNSRFEILTGQNAAALIGNPLSSVVAREADRVGAVVRGIRTQPHGEQTTLPVSLRTDAEETVACQLTVAVVSHPDTAAEIVGTVRPVDTAEAELERRAEQQAAVATLGQLAVESDDLDELMATAARLVGETLDCEYAKVLDLDGDREKLRLRQGVGWQPGTVGSTTVDSNANSQAGYTLLSEAPVIVDDLDSESRFTGPELLTSHDVTSGISVIIGSLQEPWGILGVHDTRYRQFTDEDATFVQSMANVLASAIDRHHRTQELTQYERIIETVNDGVYTVDPEGQFTMVNRAFCELTGYDREELLGADDSLLVGEEVRAAISELEAEMASGSVESPSIEAELETATGERLVVETTFALLSTDDRWERIGVVRDISEQKAYQTRLETKQTKLAALNEVNTVVREITNAVLDQSTRQEIEQQVCDSLAATETYQFAWIGEVDTHTQEIEPHAEAGVSGYLDEVTISVDPADPMSRGPAGRAVETQEIQVSQNVFTDPDFEPWRAIANEWEYQSLAAVPITHDGTLYGVLGLYSQDAAAFSEAKQAIIGQIGEIIGHAIAATERKQALMGDTVTELEFEIRDVFSTADLVDAPPERMILDRTISISDGQYLQYGRATTEMIPAFERLTAQLSSVESFTTFEQRETMTAFELRLSEPPVCSMVADAGGSVEAAVIEDGDLRATVHLPQTVSVRQVLNRIQEAYPTTRPTARRQVSRSAVTTNQAERVWTGELTDKQRASLEAAYYSGFFEWPRNSSATEVATSMDVSAATFSQHLRAAERKLFNALFADQ